MISEFMADNDESLADEDGEFSDWLEIRNPESAPFDLSGCFLTDDPGQPTKWRFPDNLWIEGNGYLVVFASGKDRAMADSELHCSFELLIEKRVYT